MQKKTLRFRERLIVTNHGSGNKPRAIVIHETDNESPSAGALNHGLYFATPGVRTSCHYVIDDGEILRLLAHDKAAWHCGKPLGEFSNSNTLGIEICVNGRYFPAWYRAAVLTASLMDEIGTEIVLRHRDVSGKYCPRRMLDEPGLWDQFLALVQANRQQWRLEQMPSWYCGVSGGQGDTGIVTADSLNVRSGRGTDHNVIGQLRRGTAVQLLYLMKGWWSIDFGADVGFVSARYIQSVGVC